MEEAVAEYYTRVKDRVEEDEFLRAVEDMVVRMNGLCDRTTAAQLVASQLGYDEWRKIGEVKPQDNNVMLKGRITDILGTRDFTRDDGSHGKVCNLLLSDETGEIKVAVWDSLADLFEYGEYKVGDNVRLRGYVKQGLQERLEVNVNSPSTMEKTSDSVTFETPLVKITDLKAGMGNVNVRCRVLEIEDIRRFQRRDGSGEGVVRTLHVGDENGRTRVSLWGEHAEAAGEIQTGDSLLLEHAYTREFRGSVDVNVGMRGLVKRSDENVDYSPSYTAVNEIELNATCSVRGDVSGMDEVREFTRKDGGDGRVGSFYLSDETGRVRVTLWDDRVEALNDISLGQQVEVIDGYVREGIGGELELSVGWRGDVRKAG